MQPGETAGAVIHQALATKSGVELGDQTIITRDDRESQWEIVGILYDPVNSGIIHLPQESLALFLGDVNRADALWLNTTTSGAASGL